MNGEKASAVFFQLDWNKKIERDKKNKQPDIWFFWPELMFDRQWKNFDDLSDMNVLRQNLLLLLLLLRLISLLLYHSAGSSFPQCTSQEQHAEKNVDHRTDEERGRENKRTSAKTSSITKYQARTKKPNGSDWSKNCKTSTCVYISTMILLQRKKSKLEEGERQYLNEKKKKRTKENELV